MSKTVQSNAARRRAHDLQVTDPVCKPGTDTPELRASLAKAMCRQYIMWPTNGLLPCEKEGACDQLSKCLEMAESVLDYRRNLATTNGR